jgi:hypothetical protein
VARQAKLTIIVALLACGFFLFSKSDTSFSKIISSSLAPHPRWAISDPPPEGILSQKFTYLAEGAQAIAFTSSDGKYVLKVFKMRNLTPSWTDKLCPHVVRRRLKNLNYVFNGYRNAYQDLRKDTGLVWIHLAKTDGMHQTLTLIDRDGKEYLVDADTTEFVIQEKAELIFDRLSRLRSEGRTSELEEAIALVHALVKHRIDMGYADRDYAVSNNYGFVGNRPIQIDIGRLYRGHKEKQLEHVVARINRWRSDQPSS